MINPLNNKIKNLFSKEWNIFKLIKLKAFPKKFWEKFLFLKLKLEFFLLYFIIITLYYIITII